MKAYVDKDLCIGCGLCEAISSDLFIMEDDGKAVSSEKELDIQDEEFASDAQEQCPVDAIDLH